MKPILRILLKAYDCAVFYLALAVIGVLCLVWSLSALLLYVLVPRALGRRLGRFAITKLFQFFVGMLTLSRRFSFDLAALDAIKDEPSLIIAPNHPSLWDVLLIVSRVPDVACIMKGALIGNLFLGGGSRLAGYIRNESLRRMVMLAVEDLRRGSRLLLFPEGTRTVRPPVGPLKGSIALIACRAQAQVQTVLIETDSPFLAKGWPIYRMPRLPLTCRVRLGRRFEAPASTAVFMRELEAYFATALDDAEVPVLSAAVAMPRTTVEAAPAVSATAGSILVYTPASAVAPTSASTSAPTLTLVTNAASAPMSTSVPASAPTATATVSATASALAAASVSASTPASATSRVVVR